MCSKLCRKEAVSGPNNCNWGGGRKFKTDGHVLQYAPNHPQARKNFVPEHRLIMEKIMGRYLTEDERVHHKNCDPSDNNPSNLVLSDKNKHSKIHANLEKCIKALMAKNLVVFNEEKMMYEVST